MIVTTNGCFDGLHQGHFLLLGYARALGDQLIVGINNDRYIENRKQRKPYYCQEARRDALLGTGVVDRVVIYEEDDPRVFLSTIKPDIHCIGVEYRGRAVEEDMVVQNGGKMVYFSANRIMYSSTMNPIQRYATACLMDDLAKEVRCVHGV